MEQATEVEIETVERVVSRGRLHEPASRAPGLALPGIVLVHDVWGLSAHSRSLAAELAREGFGVLEIDLYRAMDEVAIESPGPFIRSLSDPGILADLDDAAAWLTQTDVCRGQRIGIVGVCMGGTYAWLVACRSDRFWAAAPFYGLLSYDRGMLANPDGRDYVKKPHSPLEVASALRVPLLASFGDADEFVPVEEIREIEALLRESGTAHRIDVYEGAGHAFLNRTREAAYHPAASSAAWARLVPFLHANLDDPSSDANRDSDPVEPIAG